MRKHKRSDWMQGLLAAEDWIRRGVKPSAVPRLATDYYLQEGMSGAWFEGAMDCAGHYDRLEATSDVHPIER